MTNVLSEVVKDILLPRTDAGVLFQWLFMFPIWTFALIKSWKWPRDYRHFVWGLIMVNLAWFAIRAVH